jgi:hypothetical protein
MGRLKKNMKEYRKEMAMMEARVARQPREASPPTEQNQSPEAAPEKKESGRERQNQLPPWLQKIIPLLMPLLLLLVYFLSKIFFGNK